jgi:nucleoside-diphosphate-sugar epimerase
MAIDGDIPAGLYNVITNNYTLKQIVDLMREESLKLFKREPEIDFVDTPLVNQHNYIVNDRKIRELGMQPRASLSEGIRDTLLLLS